MNRLPNTQSRSVISIVIGLLSLTVMLMVANVVISSKVARDGLVIDASQKRQQQLEQEIAKLEQQMLSQSSLTDLSAKAEENGYVPATNHLTITIPQTLANQPIHQSLP